MTSILNRSEQLMNQNNIINNDNKLAKEHYYNLITMIKFIKLPKKRTKKIFPLTSDTEI